MSIIRVRFGERLCGTFSFFSFSSTSQPSCLWVGWLQCRIIRGTELAAAQERLESLRKREGELLEKCSVNSLLEKLKSENRHVAIEKCLLALFGTA